MKKIILFLILISILALSGCGSIHSNYRELEKMLVIQTMGLDEDSGGVLLSLSPSSGSTEAKTPSCLSGTGKTITTAMERIRNNSCEEELFTGHINHVLIGEEAARSGLEHYLSYLCHAPEIRIDMPMYVLKGSTAAETMADIGTESKGISEILQSVQATLEQRGDGHVFSSVDIIRNLERNGSALICALEYSPAAESAGESENSSGIKTAAVSGYGIIRGSKLCGFTDRDQAIGVSFLMNLVGVCDIEVKDENENLVTLEIESGSSDITPVWAKDGSLHGIDISTKVKASVVEIDGSGDLNDAGYANYLTAQLEAAVSDKISSVLQLSRRLNADFMGLGEKVELKAPGEYGKLKQDFSLLLSELELRISVSGELSHTNDIKDA